MAFRSLISPSLAAWFHHDTLLTLLLFLSAVFFADVLTPLGIEAWGLYLVALWLSAQRPERAPWLVPSTTIACTALIIVAYAFKAPGVPPAISAANRALGIAIGWSAAFFLVKAARRKSERDQAHRALRDREQQLAAILDNTQAVVYLMDRRDRFVLVNRRFEELFHVTLAQLTTQSLEDLFRPSMAQAFRRSNQEVFRRKQPLETEELVPHGDQAHTYLSIKVPQISAEGTVQTVCTIATDITERKQTAQLLQQANETLEERVKVRTAELVSSHEQLRSLAIELSRTEERERQRLATDLHDNLAQLLAFCKMKLMAAQNRRGDVSTEIIRVTGFLDEALTYTRTLLADLRPPLLGDEDDLHAALAWVVEKMRRLGLTVTIEDDGQAKVLDDEVLTVTYQAIHELLVNVVKHADSKEATLCLERAGHALHATVMDQGAGFDLSRRQSSSMDGGFGLLNIRQRVEALGGRLELQSTPGHGTEAGLVMPLKAIAGSVPSSCEEVEYESWNRTAGDPSGVPDVSTSKVRILLVDDHRMMREGLRRLIEGEVDLEVVAEAADGAMAVEVARQLRPDVVIMDVNMPRMNGVEATRQITAELPHITVIGLSMHDDEKIAGAMRDAGAAAYLSKGGSCDTLADAIRRILKLRQREHVGKF